MDSSDYKIPFFRNDQLARGARHLWAGPFGLHLFWPDIWKSRFDYEPKWNKPMNNEE